MSSRLVRLNPERWRVRLIGSDAHRPDAMAGESRDGLTA